MSRIVIAIMLVALLACAACNTSAPTNQGANQNAAPAAATNPDVKDPDGFTPLMNAVKNGDVEGSQRALAGGANVNAANDGGITALYLAAGLGNMELTQLLLAKGANANAKTTSGFTPLMQAAMTGQTEIIKVLMTAGADATAVDTISKKNAADFAQQSPALDDAKKREIIAILKVQPTQASAGQKK